MLDSMKMSMPSEDSHVGIPNYLGHWHTTSWNVKCVPFDNAIKRPIAAALQPSVPSLGITLLGSLSFIGMISVVWLTSATPRHLLGDQVDIKIASLALFLYRGVLYLLTSETRITIYYIQCNCNFKYSDNRHFWLLLTQTYPFGLPISVFPVRSFHSK